MMEFPDTVDVPVPAPDGPVAIPLSAERLAAMARRGCTLGPLFGYSFNGAGVFAVFEVEPGLYQRCYGGKWMKHAAPVERIRLFATSEEAEAAFRRHREEKLSTLEKAF